MPEREYKRLTRARRRAKFAVSSAGNSSLWLGKDHLLCIDTTGYTEAYKRFYFRDIQALSLRKTDGYKWWSLAFAVLALAFFLPAMLSSEPVAKYIFGSVAGVLVLLLLIHLALGPSCACQIQTAVQLEDLPSLHRLRRARAVLERVRPFVAAAQGALAPEEIPTRLRALSVLSAGVPAGAASPSAGADSGAPPQAI